MRAILLTTILAVLSCSSYDMHLRTYDLRGKPKKILIGNFERRTMKYNPFVVKNFRDGLQFEFFKLGYKSELYENNEAETAVRQPEKNEKKDSRPSNGSAANNATVIINTVTDTKEPRMRLDAETIRAACKKYSADMFIQGSVTETETGDITDLKTSSQVTFIIYNGNGDLAGEARYITPDTLGDSMILSQLVNRFAVQLDQKVR